MKAYTVIKRNETIVKETITFAKFEKAIAYIEADGELPCFRERKDVFSRYEWITKEYNEENWKEILLKTKENLENIYFGGNNGYNYKIEEIEIIF